MEEYEEMVKKVLDTCESENEIEIKTKEMLRILVLNKISNMEVIKSKI